MTHVNHTEQPQVLVIGTSLDPNSKSQLLAQQAVQDLQAREVPVSLLDLRQLTLPLVGEEGAWTAPGRAQLIEQIDAATHLVITAPIYNYSVGASAKGLLELISNDKLEGKTVGLAFAAGGPNSYMAALPYINSLMLDFRTWIVPRFVYALGKDFTPDGVANPQISERLSQMLDTLLSK